MARLKSPKCEHCQQTIRAKREPKEKPLPAVVDAAWLASGSSPGERWGRHLASFHPGGIEAWENARKIGHEVLMGAREIFGPYATYGNGSGPCWVGALTPKGGAVGIGHGATLPDALADARAKVEAGVVVVNHVERYTADLLFAGVDVQWPKGEPAIPKFDATEEQEKRGDKEDIRLWAEEHIVKTCLTFDETQRVLDRFMATRQEQPEELPAAEAFAREHEDDETPEEEPGEQEPAEDMMEAAEADLDEAERELAAV